MSDLFSQKIENVQEKSKVFLKRSLYEVEIRRETKNEKISQLRAINLSIGPHIKAVIAQLPKTFSEVYAYLIENSQYHKPISKQIINRIYVQQASSKKSSQTKFQILPLQPPNSLQMLAKELYFVLILLQRQGKHAPLIFSLCFRLLKQYAQSLKALHLLFDLINVVVKQKQLNWIPFDELITIINMIQEASPNDVSKQEIQCYYNIVKNYYQKIKDIPEIKNRIAKVLRKGSDCLQIVKPKIFFKLCLVLTYEQGQKQNGTQANQDLNSENKRELFFIKAMLKGSLIKTLYKQIFYSSNLKIRLICLDILANLIIQLNSSFLWSQQKINPIQMFQTEIKDKNNCIQIFYGFCQVFLLSIYKIPNNLISKILDNQVDCLNLILYILEHCQDNSQKQNQIRFLAEECLWIMLEQGAEEVKIKVANLLIQKNWKKVMHDDSEIVLYCYKILQLQP